MSLDKFSKHEKNQDDAKASEKPAAKLDAAKKEKPQKAIKKAPARSKAKLARTETDEEARDEDASRGDATIEEDAETVGSANVAAPPRESALKAMGLEKYALTCPACKYKKELRIAGEPKAHQLLCKKCGGQMKASKKA
jgi:hypothetical protein